MTSGRRTGIYGYFTEADNGPRGLAVVALGLLVAAVLWVCTWFGAGVVCWFTFGKDEIPLAADLAANLAPRLVAVSGGIGCGRLILSASGNRRGSAAEQSAAPGGHK